MLVKVNYNACTSTLVLVLVLVHCSAGSGTPLFFLRDVAKYVKDRNIPGNGRGFMSRVLKADSAITHQRCMKYFLHCER